MRREAFRVLAVAFWAGAQVALAPTAPAGPHDALIAKHAAANGVPEHLVHRIIRIESRGNAAAVHRGNYGLMQIRFATARGVGYSGEAQGLLDPDTNLTYAVRYLAGAYRAAGCDGDRAVRYYQRGYYGAATRECGGSSPTVQVAAAKPADVIKPKLVRTETIAAPNSAPAPARPIGSFEPKRVAPPPPPVVQPVAITEPAPPKLEAKLEAISNVSAPAPLAKEPAATFELASIPLPPVRPIGSFEPRRVTPPLPPVVQPVAIANPTPPKPESKPDAIANVNAPVPPAKEPAATFELASIPMPPVRPVFDPAPKQTVQPVQRSERKSKRANRKPNAEASSDANAKSKSDSKFKIDSPAAVVTYLKKLVTPDTKPTRRAVHVQANPPSQTQPPQ
jgi:hypothetical protein